MKHIYIIIGIALVLLMSIGAVSAEEEWVWATEETGYPEEYLKTITPWFPSCGYCCEADDADTPSERYLTIDSYGNTMLAFYPPDAKAPYGRFADGSPIPDGYLNPIAPMPHKSLAEQRDEFAQMPKRPHTSGRVGRR